MLDFLFSTEAASSTITLTTALVTMLTALLLGGFISFIYAKTAKSGTASRNFTWTLIFLPIVISVIILLIGSNVARAFSLAGAFSIIRFRSAPGDPKDITYVLFTMAAGLACGVGLYGYAILFTVILCMIMLLLSKTRFGSPKAEEKLLQITIPEDLDYDGVFDDLFKNYTNGSDLKRIKTTALGSLYQLTYIIKAKDGMNTKEFIDALRCRNGNLSISLSMYSENTDLY